MVHRELCGVVAVGQSWIASGYSAESEKKASRQPTFKKSADCFVIEIIGCFCAYLSQIGGV
jgi:hypothetical protein